MSFEEKPSRISVDILHNWLEKDTPPYMQLPPAAGSASRGYLWEGSTVRGPEGARFVAKTASNMVYFVVNEQPYVQDKWSFSKDITWHSFAYAAQTAAIWPVLHKWMMYGLAAGVGGFAPWILMAGDLLMTIPQGANLRDFIRKLAQGITALLAARKAMKTIAPVFYDKLFMTFLLGTGKHLPSVATAEDVIKLLGGIVRAVWKKRFIPRIKFWRVLVISAKKTLVKVIGLLPRAAAKQANAFTPTNLVEQFDVQKHRLGTMHGATNAIVEFMRNQGVKISQKEERKISEEITMSSEDILQVLSNLRSDLPDLKLGK